MYSSSGKAVNNFNQSLPYDTIKQRKVAAKELFRYAAPREQAEPRDPPRRDVHVTGGSASWHFNAFLNLAFGHCFELPNHPPLLDATSPCTFLYLYTSRSNRPESFAPIVRLSAW